MHLALASPHLTKYALTHSHRAFRQMRATECAQDGCAQTPIAANGFILSDNNVHKNSPILLVPGSVVVCWGSLIKE